MPVFIALLRGINVGVHNRLPMAELRALCSGLGWEKVQTYIQSGNVAFVANDSSVRLEAQLEREIERRFGLSVPVIIRNAGDWPAYIGSNPFPKASAAEPNLVLLGLSKAPPNPDAARALQAHAASGERVALVGDALWIHYPGGVAKSKLTPAMIDRSVGSPVTTRNWGTVVKLAEMAQKPLDEIGP